jgi:hypothetical protein
LGVVPATTTAVCKTAGFGTTVAGELTVEDIIELA